MQRAIDLGVLLVVSAGCGPGATSRNLPAGAAAGSPPGSGGSFGAGAGGGGGAGGSDVVIPLDAGARSDGNATCATDTKQADERPLDLYVLLDQSGSMTKFAPNRWEPTVAALKDFVTGGRLDGVGMGLNYFPQALGQVASDIADETIKCDPATYRTPAVPIALLPGNAKALTDSIDAAAATIKTYVVGIGPDVGNLDAWAVAGGTGQSHAFLVQIDAMARQQFLATLLSIRSLALPCDFAIPTVSAGALDPTKVNVQHAVPGMAPVRFTQVPDAATCQPNQPNWYYDDPAKPSRVVMCPGACAELGQGGKVEIVYGCKTDVAVVH
jgi:hypothetical protein